MEKLEIGAAQIYEAVLKVGAKLDEHITGWAVDKATMGMRLDRLEEDRDRATATSTAVKIAILTGSFGALSGLVDIALRITHH